MAIPSKQIQRWATPVTSRVPQQKAHQVLRALSKDLSRTIPHGEVDVYLQGSYGNGTNINTTSDVDVIVELKSFYYEDRVPLRSPICEEQVGHFVPDHYSLGQFRQLVIKRLVQEFGYSSIVDTDITLTLTGDIDTDILVCCTYRNSSKGCTEGSSAYSYLKGTVFSTREDGRLVVGFPKMHLYNGNRKQEATNPWFKRTVRMVKHMRNELSRAEVISSESAPSHLIECLVYNVPNPCFGGTRVENFLSVLGWLEEADLSKCLYQHEQYPLFGSGVGQWQVEEAERLIAGLRELWDRWDEFHLHRG